LAAVLVAVALANLRADAAENPIFSFDVTKTSELGNFKTCGLELAAIYSVGDITLSVSHNYTKLSDFDLDQRLARQNVSASAHGYGDDPANWSNHVTKLQVDHQLTPGLSAYGSLRLYWWGYPGDEDPAEYNTAVLGGGDRLALTDRSEEAWEESIFLNLGLRYKLSENTTLGFDMYNVLGWFDEDLNKRNFFQRTSQYRTEAAAVGLSITHSF
jgi:outer membrane receptor protein involved in Fe transport